MGELQHSTKELMKLVLSAYVTCGVIGKACDTAGVRRKTHYEWMAKHAKYRELFEELREKFVDGLEQVAIDRAMEKSDNLLMFLLKAERREKYGDRQDIALSGQMHKPPIQLVFAEGMLTESERMMLQGPPVGGNGYGLREQVESAPVTAELQTPPTSA